MAKLNASGTALVYATYLGDNTPKTANGGPGSVSSGVTGSGIAVDAAGDAYVTGLAGPSFPTTSSALDSNSTATLTNFVSVLNPTGAGLLYSTYLPGAVPTSSFQNPGSPGGAIALASGGNGLSNVSVTGFVGSGFATTTNALQSTYLETSPHVEAFYADINPNLSGASALVYSTYLGGTYNGSLAAAIGTGVAVDASGNAYLTGWTESAAFPTTAGAFETANNGGMYAYVAKIDPALSGTASLVYSTLLGGTSGKTGYISDMLSVLTGEVETGPAIAIDSSGDAYVAGMTDSTTFPTTAGAFQTTYANTGSDSYYGNAFVSELNPSGSAPVYSTYLGGNTGDGATCIAVDAGGDAYLTGWTQSSNFPTKSPIQGSKGNGTNPLGGPNSNAFVAVLNPTGSALDFSTYLGGTNDDYGFGIALDPNNNVYITGVANSANFPTTSGAYDTTTGGGFVAKITGINTGNQGSFSIGGVPSTVAAGTPETITVTALNPNGTVNTGYTGTVQFTSTDPKAALPANYTFIAADQGTYTFPVTLKTAGTQSITVTDVSTGIAGSETGIAVTPAVASQFILSAPSSVQPSAKFSVTLTVEDAYGNVVTGYTGTVHFTSSDSKAVLPANFTFTAADDGTYTFTNKLELKTKGEQTLTVTDASNSTLTAIDDIDVL